MKTIFRFFAIMLALNVLVAWAGQAKAGEWASDAAWLADDMGMHVQGGAPSAARSIGHSDVVDQLADLISGAWIDRVVGKSLDGDNKSGKKPVRSETAPRFGLSANSHSVRLKMAMRF